MTVLKRNSLPDHEFPTSATGQAWHAVSGAEALSAQESDFSGLTEAEIGLARNSEFQPVSLGPRVLRMETAATAALAIVQSSLGNI